MIIFFTELRMILSAAVISDNSASEASVVIESKFLAWRLIPPAAAGSNYYSARGFASA